MNSFVLQFLPYIIGAVALASGYTYAYFSGKSACQEEYTRQTLIAFEKANILEAELIKAVSDVDSNHFKIREVENENDNLRRAVDNGNKRLLIAAKCPINVSPTSESTSLDNGRTAELDPEARPDYFSLRNGIERQREQLMACQQILLKERKILENVQ